MNKLRKRGQLLPIVGINLLVLFTLATAGANMMPVNRATDAELRAVEQAELVTTRKERIVELRTRASECHPAMSHELAKQLVMDGQFDEARAFAAVYQLRCGEDSVVANWGNAPQPRAR